MNSTVSSGGVGINVGGKHIPSDYVAENSQARSTSPMRISENSNKDRSLKITKGKTSQLKAESSTKIPSKDGALAI